jgi:hypothetical protein
MQLEKVIEASKIHRQPNRPTTKRALFVLSVRDKISIEQDFTPTKPN